MSCGVSALSALAAIPTPSWCGLRGWAWPQRAGMSSRPQAAEPGLLPPV
ncbi:hypothetical protein ACFFX0_19635 [Citricoccus parietis]|uniref:Uncharacterized protein n=1 Tax=Citricoccus parietis TaxID=592307 RepID=A0ABV5G2X8_9MICC